jgi:ribosome biogenesis protein Tsr3
VFESRVLRRIYGPKRDQVIGEWRKLHNEELHELYSSPSTSIIRKIKSRRMGWAGHVARMGEKRNAYRLLGKPEGKRPLGRPRRRLVDNMRIFLVDVGWCDVDRIGVAQDKDRWRALVNSVLNLRDPYNVGKLSSVLTARDLSSSDQQLHRAFKQTTFRLVTVDQR